MKKISLQNYLHVKPSSQTLDYIFDGEIKNSYVISTAKNGLGEEKGSYKTPRGWHIIRAKIGDGEPTNTVFISRRPTGEIYSEELVVNNKANTYALNLERDWILTRILWLSGLEVGKNRLGSVDTMQRYIYIHGVPDTTQFGIPNSKGCIRMKNSDLLELFSIVKPLTKIFIGDNISFTV